VGPRCPISPALGGGAGEPRKLRARFALFQPSSSAELLCYVFAKFIVISRWSRNLKFATVGNRIGFHSRAQIAIISSICYGLFCLLWLYMPNWRWIELLVWYERLDIGQKMHNSETEDRTAICYGDVAVCVSVWLSVCLSRWCVVPERPSAMTQRQFHDPFLPTTTSDGCPTILPAICLHDFWIIWKQNTVFLCILKPNGV